VRVFSAARAESSHKFNKQAAPPGLDLPYNIRYGEKHEFDAHQAVVSGVLSHVTPAFMLSEYRRAN
jgi:hypothetical protein